MGALNHKSYWTVIASLRLEKDSKITGPTFNPPPLLNHIPKCHIHPLFEHFQEWCLHHFPQQPIIVPESNDCAWELQYIFRS